MPLFSVIKAIILQTTLIFQLTSELVILELAFQLCAREIHGHVRFQKNCRNLAYHCIFLAHTITLYILCIQLTSMIKCFSHKERLCATSDQLCGYKAKENYPQHFSRFLKALPSPSTSYMYFCFSYRNMVPDI